MTDPVAMTKAVLTVGSAGYIAWELGIPVIARWMDAKGWLDEPLCALRPSSQILDDIRSWPFWDEVRLGADWLIEGTIPGLEIPLGPFEQTLAGEDGLLALYAVLAETIGMEQFVQLHAVLHVEPIALKLYRRSWRERAIPMLKARINWLSAMILSKIL